MRYFRISKKILATKLSLMAGLNWAKKLTFKITPIQFLQDDCEFFWFYLPTR